MSEVDKVLVKNWESLSSEEIEVMVKTRKLLDKYEDLWAKSQSIGDYYSSGLHKSPSHVNPTGDTAERDTGHS